MFFMSRRPNRHVKGGTGRLGRSQKRPSSPFRRRAFLERLEDRLAMDAGGSVLPIELIAADVNRDQHVTPIDVLLVVNELNRRVATNAPSEVVELQDRQFDTNADGFISPIDAMLIIDAIDQIAADSTEFMGPVSSQVWLTENTAESEGDDNEIPQVECDFRDIQEPSEIDISLEENMSLSSPSGSSG